MTIKTTQSYFHEYIEYATTLPREELSRNSTVVDIGKRQCGCEGCQCCAAALVYDIRQYADELGIDSVVSYSHNTLHRLYKAHNKTDVDFALAAHWRQWGANQERLEQGGTIE